MATLPPGQTLRRGLPRRPGGEAWPPASAVALAVEAADPVAEAPIAAAAPVAPAQPAVAAAPVAAAPTAPVAEPVEASPSPTARPLRRGLPRRPGGEPWPSAGLTAAASVAPLSVAPQSAAPVSAAPVAESVGASPAATPVAEPVEASPSINGVAEAPAVIAPAGTLRRGLPRATGGEPWPPVTPIPVRRGDDASTGSATGVAAATAPTDDASTGSATGAVQPTAAPAASPATDAAIELRPAASAVAVPEGPRPPLPFPRTVFPGAAAASRPTALPEPLPNTLADRLRRPTWTLAISGLLGALALLILALMAVFATRWIISLPFMQDFLTTYPGEYPLPEGSQQGFPVWLQWQHFFNTFLIVLIIRTGLQVRTDKRPSVFWTPKWSKNGKGKISLSLWFHQSLDVLWLVNGLLFIALLFATGHWVRIVPTSWEVFPNALSAAIQYVSLDWPTENGWVNYNSLQQLAYFATVFVAAPLAVITGVRMSGFWPKNAEALNKAYPIEWARAVHFPVMLYFVAFIIVHVALVFATGALRNLNHMYGGSDVVNWVGFWIFIGSMVIIGIGWIAARPLVLAPIAALSGRVSGR